MPSNCFFIMSLFYATCLFAPATLISGSFSFGKTYFVSYGEVGELVMKLLRAALAASRSRAWSVAIGRSGLGCHCEKGEPVTARKANHNASNATVVIAGKMVCVSVKYRRPNRWTDQIWHAYADGPGDGSYLKKIDLPTQGGVEVGILGGQKIKSPVNFMNCRENR